MPPRQMTMDEKIIRQAIATIQEAIDRMCIQRDELAAMLPRAPKPARVTHIGGIEIKPGGGKCKKREVNK